MSLAMLIHIVLPISQKHDSYSDLTVKNKIRKKHLEHFETEVLIGAKAQTTRLYLPFLPPQCEQFDLPNVRL